MPRRARPFAWLVGVSVSALFAAAVAWSGACSPDPFACTTAVTCINADGVQGVCVTGFCAYADPTCPATHERYSVSAGNDMASACVPVDAGSTDAGFDAGMGVAVTSCGTCSATELCATTTTPSGDGGDAGGTTTFKCWPIPSACATAMTCGCAYELCGLCGCQGVTDAGVQCACGGP